MIYWINNLFSILLVVFLWQQILKYSSANQSNSQIVYLILAQMILAITPEIIYRYSQLIQSGDIAYKLLLPVKFEFWLLLDTLGYSLAKLLIIFPLDMGIVFIFFPGSLSIMSGLLLLLLFPMTFVLGFTIELLFSSVTLFTYSVWGINTIKSAVLMVLSGAYFPVSLLPSAMKKFVSVLPFSYAYGQYAEVIITPTVANVSLLVIPQIIWTIILYWFYVMISRVGFKQFVTQGG
ncbi:ABC-2 family transporter protein [Periweissella ghanensis]|nr:ABC-2 family transporter protein [Periweissella ghanensis]MCM0600973.1 ABC-2 family transporter protein [Periweissella ghanensis]